MAALNTLLKEVLGFWSKDGVGQLKHHLEGDVEIPPFKAKYMQKALSMIESLQDGTLTSNIKRILSKHLSKSANGFSNLPSMEEYELAWKDGNTLTGFSMEVTLKLSRQIGNDMLDFEKMSESLKEMLGQGNWGVEPKEDKRHISVTYANVFEYHK